MSYDEDLLVELIACGDVSQTEIAERVGVSRRTVWRIANGQSRPDLQTKIAATVEGYRQAAVRLAARFMTPLLKKQIEVALGDNPSTGLKTDGETARKCREFLLKTFMIALPPQTIKATTIREPDHDKIALGVSLAELSPDLKDQIIKELDGPAGELKPVISDQSSVISERQRITDDGHDEGKGKEEKKKKKKPKQKSFDPFAEHVDGPHGTKVRVHALALEREYLAEMEADNRPPRRRVRRAPRE
jgi:transcriptional regulator with XRE-family HTH domain